MTARDIYQELRRLAPSVWFNATHTPDPYFSWDGDGPDPREEGYDPCTVVITAATIRIGGITQGESSLSGYYTKPGKSTDDLDGYLPQMLDEATVELQNRIPESSPIYSELKAVGAFLAQEMRDRYESQSNPIAGASDNPA